MRLRNKKTGEIVEVESCNSTTGTIGLFFAEGRECDRAYSSLAELNEEWEDCEELKEYWYIDWDGKLMVSTDEEGWEAAISIGNYFETKEEAEQAVRKLKAWKRLKDKGIFIYLDHLDFRLQEGSFKVEFPNNNLTNKEMVEVDKDLDLLFSQEDEE